jgi:hypothetical protein
LPNLPKDIKIESHTDVQVTEASVKGGIVTGSVRNNTDRPYHAAELVFDLTDSVGSQVGAITTTVRDLGAKATVRFSVPIKQRDAAFVLVREVHTE